MSEDIAYGFLHPYFPEGTIEFLEWHKRAFNEAIKNAEVIDSTKSHPISEKSKIIIGIIGMGSGPGSALIRRMVIQAQECEIFTIRESYPVKGCVTPKGGEMFEACRNLHIATTLASEQLEKLSNALNKLTHSKKKRTKNNRKHSKRR